MTERKYPRPDTDYPEIVSKVDPFVIRVSPTVLVMGSTSYTAKIKMGMQFNGFVIYASSVGIPIYTEAVDISGESNNGSLTGEGSDAWNYIKDKARDWLDDLEKSMISDTTDKNVIQLLRELKFQMHYDMSGCKANSAEYGSTLELCTETEHPSYNKLIYEELSNLNIKFDNIYSKLDNLSTQLENIDTTLRDDVCTAITEGYSTIASAIDYQTGRIDNLITEVNTVKSTTNTIKNTTDTIKTNTTTINNKIGTSNDSVNTTVFGTLNNTKTKVYDISTSIGNSTTSDTLLYYTKNINEYTNSLWDRISGATMQEDWINPNSGNIHLDTWVIKTPYAGSVPEEGD